MTSAVHRVVVWGTCDTGKPRVRILLQGLRAHNVEIVECRFDPWTGVRDKSQAGLLLWCWILVRMVFSYPVLVVRYLRLPRHDWVLLGYPAIPDVLLIRLFAWLRRTPVAMDWFLSAYDTIVLDRGLLAPRNPLSVLIWCAEWLAIRAPDLLFMDTRAHAERMETLFSLGRGRCRHVWVGVEAATFTPGHCAKAPETSSDAVFRVLFYGQFIPLHGVQTIVEAARRLRDAPIEWLLIGRGQDSPRIRAQLDAQPLERLRWVEWAEYAALLDHMAHADVCLGIFGTSDKAASVIPNKIFQAVAARRPVVTRDSPAIRELLSPDRNCVHLVPAGDPDALAATIADLATRPREASRVECHLALLPRVDERAIGAQLKALLAERTVRGLQR